MNTGTVITLLIVAVMLFFALRSVVRDFRSGTSKCAECGKPCGKAAGAHCEIAEQMARNLEQSHL